MELRDVLGLPIKEAYDLFLVLRKTVKDKKVPDRYHRIRYGERIRFDIYDVFNDNYTIKHKSRRIIIGNRYIPLDTFYSEIEARETEIKESVILLLDLLNPELLEPRD